MTLHVTLISETHMYDGRTNSKIIFGTVAVRITPKEDGVNIDRNVGFDKR